MSVASGYFEPLIQKLQLLLKQHEQVIRENDKLKQEVVRLREQAKTSENTISGLLEQVALLQRSAGKLDEAAKKTLEKRLNQYIRDIDKVMAHLNNA